MEYQIQIGERKIDVLKTANETRIDGVNSPYSIEKLGNRYVIYGEHSITEVTVLSQHADRLTLLVNGKEIEVQVRDHIALMLDKLGMTAAAKEVVNEVRAPMPGVIQNILVSAGQQVKKGEPLLVLEAMKMENMIKAPADVTIASIDVTRGQSVEKNASLIRFE